jgi:methionyl aminopeptidase
MDGIIYKTNEEVELIRKSSLLVSATLATVAKEIKEGMTTLSLNDLIDTFIQDNNGYPIFKGYEGFPAAACISINEEVVHGIPSKRKIMNGDLVSVDVGVLMNEFIGDSAYTFAVGEVSDAKMKLLQITKQSLYKGINAAKFGNRIGDIGYEIQSLCENAGYSVVSELVGHGLGRELHEEPQVPNYGRRGSGKKICNGLVIAIEPMINLGKKEVKVGSDGWTYLTKDGMASAHFEHTIVIRSNVAEILSTFAEIEKEELKNKNLTTVKING